MSFWTYVHVLNCLTDIALVILPLVIVLDLQMSLGQKVRTMLIFAVRIFTIAATIAEIVLLLDVLDTADPTFEYWLPSVFAGLVQSLSIITSCLPYLKPFLESFQSGMIRSDDFQRTTGALYGSGGSQSAGKRPSGRGWRKVTPSPPSSGNQHELMNISALDKDANVISIRANRPLANDQNNMDSHSQGSRSRIITRTMEWTVSTEETDQMKEEQGAK